MLTVREAAAMLKRTPQAVHQLLQRRRLHGVQVHARLWLIPREEVERQRRERACPICGTPLSGGAQRRYCSNRCRRKARSPAAGKVALLHDGNAVPPLVARLDALRSEIAGGRVFEDSTAAIRQGREA